MASALGRSRSRPGIRGCGPTRSRGRGRGGSEDGASPGPSRRITSRSPLPPPGPPCSGHVPANAGSIRDVHTAGAGRRRVCRSRSAAATDLSIRRGATWPLFQIDRAVADARLWVSWVYRPVKRTSPDVSGRKPLENPALAGGAIGFKSPSSHSICLGFLGVARVVSGLCSICAVSVAPPSSHEERTDRSERPSNRRGERPAFLKPSVRPGSSPATRTRSTGSKARSHYHCSFRRRLVDVAGFRSRSPGLSAV
jgi:hypothetical protein